ncbi:TIGR03545 family protein [Nitrospira sp. M1]
MKTLVKWSFGLVSMLILVLAVFWIFIVDTLVENIIETKGTEIVGAKVELDAADLSLFPSGLTLTRLQVTNPDKPMSNAVDIARMAMGLDVLPLLWSQVIIEEMAVEGVQFGTERSASGAIRNAPVSEPAESAFALSLPALEIPNVKEILEKEDLETVRLIETLKSDIQHERDIWEERLKQLPGKEQVKKYKQRVKQVKKSAKGGIGGVLSGVEEVQSLKKEIETDVRQVKDAKQEFEEKIALLKTRLAQIKAAPQRDIQHLQKKYNLSPQGLANLSQSLLGSHIGSWVQQAVAWYERLKPYLEQGEGAEKSEVPASSDGPGVAFLIRLANVSLNLDVGDLSGTVRNITPEQATFGQPLTFAFSGEKLKGVRSLMLEGTLDHRQPAQALDQMQFVAKNFHLQDIVLSKDAQLPVSLNDGAADIAITASLNGQALNAKGSGQLTGLNISAGSQQDTRPLTQSLRKAIADVSQLSVKANVTGTIEHYDVALESDLDEIVQRAAGKMVNEVAVRFQQDLQVAIQAKTKEPIRNVQKRLGSLGAVGGDLTDRLTQNNTLLQDLLTSGKSKSILPRGLKLPF